MSAEASTNHQTAVPADRETSGIRVLVALSAITFSAIYICSDIIELVQGGFSTFQLALTYAAEVTIPLFVLGLYAVQRPGIGRLGLLGAVGYAYVYTFFAGTVTYALVEHSDDWTALNDRLGPWMTIHGVLMVIAGGCFGWAVARAGVLPPWTGYTLIAGVILVAATASAPDLARTIAATVRAAAFIAMGAALLRTSVDQIATTERGRRKASRSTLA